MAGRPWRFPTCANTGPPTGLCEAKAMRKPSQKDAVRQGWCHVTTCSIPLVLLTASKEQEQLLFPKKKNQKQLFSCRFHFGHLGRTLVLCQLLVLQLFQLLVLRRVVLRVLLVLLLLTWPQPVQRMMCTQVYPAYRSADGCRLAALPELEEVVDPVDQVDLVDLSRQRDIMVRLLEVVEEEAGWLADDEGSNASNVTLRSVPESLTPPIGLPKTEQSLLMRFLVLYLIMTVFMLGILVWLLRSVYA